MGIRVIVALILVIGLPGCREDDPEKEKRYGASAIQLGEPQAPVEPLQPKDYALPLAIAIPLLILAYAALRLRKTMESQQLMRLMERALEAQSPEEAADRVRILAGVMGKLLPIQTETAVQKLVAERVERAGLPKDTVERRMALIRMLAEYPEQRDQILADWETCFGDADSWALHIRQQASGSAAQPASAPDAG
jgi:hypothetical protein